MRVIDTELGEVRAAAVSPDGRFVAVSGAAGFGLFEWATGARVPGTPGVGGAQQIAFAPAGKWAARVPYSRLHLHGGGAPDTPLGDRSVRFAGGVAVSPDGKLLVATTATDNNRGRLEVWALPAAKPSTGFNYWLPFRRLAFSPDGQFLAGIGPVGFELRFAASGGIDYRGPTPRDPRNAPTGFVSFDRESRTCAFGWSDQFHLLDIATGTSKPGATIKAAFADAAFGPGADLFATVGADGRLKLWEPAAWRVTREYDWRCGPLTCLAFTADGAAGVCGAASGQLVQFDVDE